MKRAFFASVLALYCGCGTDGPKAPASPVGNVESNAQVDLDAGAPTPEAVLDASGPAVDAGPPAHPSLGREPGYGFVAGEPFAVPSQDAGWTFVPVEGTQCMDDSATGIGVHAGSIDKLLIFFEHGGACVNTLCDTTTFFQGFAEKDLLSRVNFPTGSPAGILNPSDPHHPFAGYHIIFIPYCSGDIFVGSAREHTGVNGKTQVGFQNVRKMIARIAPTYRFVDEVVIAGSSAGGFGVLFNWLPIQEAFGATPVHAIDDSGPPLGPKALTPCMLEQLARDWKWQEALPKGCRDCAIDGKRVDPPAMLRYLVTHFPERRFAFMSYSYDTVMSLFFGFGQNDCNPLLPLVGQDVFAEELKALRSELGSAPNFASWYMQGSGHTFLVGGTGGDFTAKNGTVVMGDWLSALADPGAKLTHVGP